MKSDPEEVRRKAERILAQRRFRTRRTPRPFASVFKWIARQLGILGRWIGRLLDAILPGGSGAASVIGVIAAIALLVAIVILLNRANIRKRVKNNVATTTNVNIDELLAAAEAASKRGDFAEAVRLRFKAGLASFERNRVVTMPTNRTNRDVGAQLRTSTSTGVDTHFQPLATDFDEIRYGNRVAQQHDDHLSRESWQRIQDEVKAGSSKKPQKKNGAT